MNSNASLQVVPSSNDRLRSELAERDRLASVSADISSQIDKLAPFQAEVAMANAELQNITQRDAEAIQEWIDGGAKGKAPEPNAKAREEAGRKLAAAQAKLSAAANVHSDLEQKLVDNNERIRAHRDRVASAEIDVVAEEVLRLVERARQTSIAVLESEAAYQYASQELRNYMSPSFGVTSPQAPAVSAWLNRINEAYQLTTAEHVEAMQRGRQRAQAVLQQLLSGEDPVK